MACSTNGSNTDTRCKIELGSNVYVVAKLWKGDTAIHIRKFDDENATLPTKRGIALTLKHWVELCTSKSQIDDTIAVLKERKEEKLFRHIESNVYVSVDNNIVSVDIRQWWWCDDAIKPSKKGIFFT
ncbi:uncharacterized protein LOC121383833 [Gigantopelta aegis]|uniref:uncharacterized protein LOC121383833 n=1 Tax=Gigantopelta aegis TaxID=1735272 RepID=UPI001B8899B1|nr:uncharacterized protein LOC121383833 [Gigantopelta aegis]